MKHNSTDGVTLGAPPKMTEDQLAAVCLAVRHDYGLLTDERRAALRHEARVWEDAFRKVCVMPDGVDVPVPLSDEQIVQMAIKAGLDEEMWFGPHTPPSGKDCLPELRKFAELARALGVAGTLNDQPKDMN